MSHPALLLVTDDNYAVGKIKTLSHLNFLQGFYQVIYGQKIRVKVHIGDGHSVSMRPEEIYQFPEDYEF